MKIVLIIIGAIVGLFYAIRREVIAREKEARGEYVDNPPPRIFALFILIMMIFGGFLGWLIYLLFK
jgi:H+/Cl- antiporter ClcA